MAKRDFSKIDLKNLACLVYEALQNNGISAILVGGACVSIYSDNRYQSYDLDFATYEELNKIEKVLKKIGFKRKGRCFSHKQCRYLIDFVYPPIAIGNESIQKFKTLKTPMGSLQLLTPTDCVKDRLASYFYWDDMQGLEQALLVAANHAINLKNIKQWAKKEGHLKKYNFFTKNLDS